MWTNRTSLCACVWSAEGSYPCGQDCSALCGGGRTLCRDRVSLGSDCSNSPSLYPRTCCGLHSTMAWNMITQYKRKFSSILFSPLTLITQLWVIFLYNILVISQSSKNSTSPMSEACKIRTGQVKFKDPKPDWACKIVESKLKKYWTKQTRILFFKSKQGQICRSF